MANPINNIDAFLDEIEHQFDKGVAPERVLAYCREHLTDDEISMILHTSGKLAELGIAPVEFISRAMDSVLLEMLEG